MPLPYTNGAGKTAPMDTPTASPVYQPPTGEPVMAELRDEPATANTVRSRRLVLWGAALGTDQPARSSAVRTRRKPGAPRRVVRTEPGLPAPNAETRVQLIAPERVVSRRDKVVRWARRLWLATIVASVVIVFVAGATTVWDRITGHRQPVQQQAATGVDQGDREAENYALRVARLWFTYSPDTRDERRAAVAQLLPGADPDIAWDGKSTSSTSDSWIVSDALVTPDLVTGQVRRIGVVVVANGQERTLLLTIGDDAQGRPQLVQFPTIGSQPAIGAVRTQQAPTVPEDVANREAARATVEGFLTAWGKGSPDARQVYSLEGFVPAPGPGNLTFVDATWQLPQGGQSRVVNVLVRWRDNDGRLLPSAYAMALVTTGARWSVSSFDVARPGTIPLTSTNS